MTKTKIIQFILLSLMLMLFIGCASEELTSAKLYIQQEDWDNAEIYLVKALAVEPENPEIPYLLGDLVYGRKNEWGKMNEMFDRALSLGRDKVILQGGTVSDYVAQARERHWVTIYNKGISYFNEFRKSGEGKDSPILHNAITSFSTATEVNPNNGQSYGILANCLFASGDLDGAIKAITTGVAKDPENFNLTMTAGKMFLAADDKESALIYYKRAVVIDPTNSLARRQLAQTYYDVGEIEMSLATYEDAITKETDNNLKADLYYNLGVLNMQLGDFQQAEDNFSLAYDYNPHDIDALRGIAQTFENAEKWSRAEYFYRKLIDIEPENPQHYRAMARVLLRQGDTDEAQKYFDKSKQL
ncbi:MAG: tetratricopeptide repeat protein [Planctomycetia bacterium]|nr:tetratricopeptide repeat protein [Planctomycetia bacterium]